MSHYKPYPAYKDSGVEWLGEVPEHWGVKQLKYLTTHIGSGKTPSGGAEVYQDSGVLFLRSQNVYEDGLRLDDAAFISEAIDNEMAGSRVLGDDVLLNITGASIGRSCRVPEKFQPANVNQHVCILRAIEPSLAKWLSLCLPSDSVQAQIDFSQNGAGREGLNFEQIGNMLITIPSVDEVAAIVYVVDCETARIDALVEKKTRFIELLREKRQALITHAVTKGLDPNIKMKDSGVEWLGEVPEDWELMPLKYVTPSLTVGIVVNPSDYVTDEGFPFIYGGDIGEGEIFFKTARRISKEDSERNAKTRLMSGDLVTVRVGAPGITAVVPPACEGGNCASVMLIRRGRFESDWLCYVMNSRVVRYQVRWFSTALHKNSSISVMQQTS
jgi:type I restriction enzyme S subunit